MSQEARTREGQQIPDAPLWVIEQGKPRRIGAREYFAGKTVIVFALPGAFTPTCSSQHLPRYEELASTFRAHGVDSIVCIAVNDAYVMAEWGRMQGLKEVELVSDGNGDFGRAMDMLLDDSHMGMGARSRRYSMLVRNGRIEKMFIEPEEPGDPYKVSDADTMLDYLAPQAPRPQRIAVLTKPRCPYCAEAMQMLKEHGLRFDEIPLEDAARTRILGALTGASTAPQVFVDGRLIGGTEALKEFLKSADVVRAA